MTEATFGQENASRTPLAQFRALVLADVSLRERLRATDDTEQFIALAVDLARERGFTLTADSVRREMWRPLPGMAGLIQEQAFEETPLPPPGWLPIAAAWQNGALYLRWAYFGDARLREPFFEGDVQRALSRPFNRLIYFMTPIGKLADWLTTNPGLRPSGFIFHMSRCGSTLVAQMLAALDQNIAVSEASPIDAVVQARALAPGLAPGEQARWLACLIGALGQPRHGERHYFIKLDCWHTLALPLFQRAFPDVPWLFLYRDPVEVLVSQIAMPGSQMIPGLVRPDGIDLAGCYDPTKPQDFYARTLAAICEPVLQHYSADRALLINYRQLPAALWTAVLPHFGVAADAADRAKFAAAARHDAKRPYFEFAGDAAAKQQAATELTRAIAAERLGDIYARLETLRRADPRSA